MCHRERPKGRFAARRDSPLEEMCHEKGSAAESGLPLEGERRVKRIGLTGGIASGKSTVARLLVEKGVPVVDADRLAREVVEPGAPALEAIGRRWPSVIRGDGTLDRKALGAIVFADPAEREALNAIVHPAIRRLSEERLAALEATGAPRAVYEAALLIENGLDREMDGTLLVTAPARVQIQRLMERDGISEAEALGRLAAQLPLEKKIEKATWIVDNAGDRQALERQLDEVWSRIVEDGPRPAPSR